MNTRESSRRIIQDQAAELRVVRSVVATFRADLQTKAARLVGIEGAQTFFQTVAQETQGKLAYHIEDIVQTALDACFPGRYEFRVVFELKRGKTEASLCLERNGQLVSPMESNGGGVVDIISFALRLAIWSLSKGSNVILLDEPFKHLSAGLQPKAGEILKELSQRLGVQIIMNTHNEEMTAIADRLFIVRLRRGVSEVEVDA